MTEPSPRIVVGVDGGNSKTDVAVVAEDGSLLAALRGPTVSPEVLGPAASAGRIASLVAQASAVAGVEGPPVVAVLALAGVDHPDDEAELRPHVASRFPSTAVSLLNDTEAGLLAGTEREWGIALICGAGVNAVGVSPTGEVARFMGIGDVSGDWGGGNGIGMEALGAAVRAGDGRGPDTLLRQRIAERFGYETVDLVPWRFRDGTIAGERIGELAPVLFATAGEGDAVARSIIDHLADELAIMAVALARRLQMTTLDPDVVLTGGVFRTDDRAFYERLGDRIRAEIPAARLVPLAAPPVLGAALQALHGLHLEPKAYRSAASQLRSAPWDFARAIDGGSEWS